MGFRFNQCKSPQIRAACSRFQAARSRALLSRNRLFLFDFQSPLWIDQCFDLFRSRCRPSLGRRARHKIKLYRKQSFQFLLLMLFDDFDHLFHYPEKNWNSLIIRQHCKLSRHSCLKLALLQVFLLCPIRFDGFRRQRIAILHLWERVSFQKRLAA